jgi:Undecaprenyl-phosphate galactose phosphotransferase WbaP
MSSVSVTLPVTHLRDHNGTISRLLTYLSIIGADLCAFLTAGVGAVFVRYYFHGEFLPTEYLIYTPCVLLMPLVFYVAGLYPGIALNTYEEFRRVLRSVTLVYLMILGFTFIIQERFSVSRIAFVLAWFLTVWLVPISRRLMRGLYSRTGWWGIPVVILGDPAVAQKVLTMLQQNVRLGLKPVAVLCDVKNRVDAPLVQVGDEIETGDLSDLELLSRRYRGAYAMVVGSKQTVLDLMEEVEAYKRIIMFPDLYGFTSLSVHATDLGGVLTMEINSQLTRRLPQIAKRCFDVVLSLCIAIVISPLLCVLSLAVLLTSSGSIFYGHRRVGQNGLEFTIWKFRTMVSNADALMEHVASDPALRFEWERNHKLRGDPRVTRIGRLMRKTSLDELPQLWNVFRGDMSLVGPRPIVRSEIVKYGKYFRQYCRVVPGMTGLWQTSGRNHTTYDIRTELDDYYVRNWSFSLDLFILLRTIRTLLLAEDAY